MGIFKVFFFSFFFCNGHLPMKEKQSSSFEQVQNTYVVICFFGLFIHVTRIQLRAKENLIGAPKKVGIS